jgi:hypothetical protein
MNGIDVSGLKVGDVLELSDDRARMMVDLGWGEYEATERTLESLNVHPPPNVRAH